MRRAALRQLPVAPVRRAGRGRPRRGHCLAGSGRRPARSMRRSDGSPSAPARTSRPPQRSTSRRRRASPCAASARPERELRRPDLLQVVDASAEQIERLLSLRPRSLARRRFRVESPRATNRRNPRPPRGRARRTSRTPPRAGRPLVGRRRAGARARRGCSPGGRRLRGHPAPRTARAPARRACARGASVPAAGRRATPGTARRRSGVGPRRPRRAPARARCHPAAATQSRFRRWQRARQWKMSERRRSAGRSELSASTSA